MQIRKATTEDLPIIMEIFKNAKLFMKKNGNSFQWDRGYPSIDIIKKDINESNSYVCLDNKTIVATFCYKFGDDTTYHIIEEGKWLNDEPYGVIHRIASKDTAKGVGTYCISYCLARCNNIRIDTHTDNIPMRNLLLKLKFFQCGIIYTLKGDKRIAYQRVD
ncbi:MAG: GNAT family N-acetyltransferase [Bacilli bacterium]